MRNGLKVLTIVLAIIFMPGLVSWAQEGKAAATDGPQGYQVNESSRTLQTGTASGTYGTIRWTYDSTAGVLDLKGNGAITANSPYLLPWYSYYYNVKTVTIGEGITEIGEGIFYSYYRLQEVKLPSTLRRIGNGAFADCSNLKKVTLNEGLAEIGQYSFQNCGMMQLQLPASLKKIDSLAFYNCTNLKTLTVAPNSMSFAAHNNVLYSQRMDTLILTPSGNALNSLRIPSSVKTINAYAFHKTAIVPVTIPNSVTTIGEGAFYASPRLKTVSIGSGVARLKEFTFCQCTALEKVTIANGVKVIAEEAFAETGITSVTLPNSVEDVAKSAFPPGTKIKHSAQLVEMEDGSATRGATLHLKVNYRYTDAYKVLDKVNSERKRAGKPALTMDQDLLDAAMLRAAEITILFSHTRPIQASCSTVSNKLMGENIAAGQGSPTEVMQSWMNSSGHRANIMGDGYTSIGIGCVKMGRVYRWVQIFGSTSPNKAKRSRYKNTTKTTAVKVKVTSSEYKSNVRVEATSKKIKAGKKSTLTYYCQGTPILAKSLTFKSSNKKVCTVNSKGVVKGKKAGKAKITVYPKGYPKVKKTITIKVQK